MPNPHLLVQGDYGDPITGTLTNGRGTPMPFPSSYPLVFAMRSSVSDPAFAAFSRSARWVDAARGRWAYDFISPELEVPGPFRAEVRVLTPGGPVTFPQEDSLDVLVRARLSSP